jgi:hypothetical protein
MGLHNTVVSTQAHSILLQHLQQSLPAGTLWCYPDYVLPGMQIMYRSEKPQDQLMERLEETVTTGTAAWLCCHSLKDAVAT